MNELIKNLMESDSLTKYEEASERCIDYFSTASGDDRVLIRNAFLKKADQHVYEAKKARQETEDLIALFKV